MGLLDLIVDTNFRREPAGRVVIFPGGPRNRGYLVKSEVEELRVRSFLKMFYCAHLSILLLGYFLASAWLRDLSRSFGPPSAFLLRTVSVTLGMYSLVVGVPYLLLWSSYKKALSSFVSAEDEIVVAGKSGRRRLWIVGIALIALSILILLGAVFLIRNTSFTN
jgi:hypothetical protein